MICSGLRCLLPVVVLLDSSGSLPHQEESFRGGRSESDIAEKVMLRMLREGSAVVLPVHDSFLVYRDYEAQLERAIHEEFKEETGQECALKFDAIDIRDSGQATYTYKRKRAG